jgi:PAS domain S-box-containing protein
MNVSRTAPLGLAELADPTSLTRVLLDSMTEGVSLSREDGTIVFTNPAEDRMFGYEPGGLLGQHVSVQNAYPPEENERVVAGVIEELKRSGSWTGEWQNRRKDGSEFITRSRISAVEIEGGPHWLCVQEEVTEAVEAARALRDERARLKLATEAGEIGIWDWDLATGRMTYSPLARAISGLPSEGEITIEDVRRTVHPEDLPFTWAQAQRALDPEVQDRSPYEYRLVHPDGSVRWVLARGDAVFMEGPAGPRAVRYLGTLQDITERRELEEAERNGAQQLRLALEAGRMAVWDLDIASNTVTGSADLYRLLGFPQGQPLTADAVNARYCPGEYERVSADGQAAFARGETSGEAEFRYRHPDHGMRWLRLRYDILLDAEGTPDRVIGVILDETERAKARLALQETEERFRLIADSAPVMLWMGDPQGKCLYLNRAQREFWGVAEANVPNYDWTPTIHPDDAPELWEPWSQAMAAREPLTVEARYRRADGQYRLLQTNAQPRFNAAGEFLGMTGVNVDVTEQRQAEAALRESEARVRALTDNLPAGMVFQIATGQDGHERRFVYVSQSHEKLTGVPAQAVMADPSIPYHLLLPESRQIVAEAEAEAIRDREPFDVQVRFRRADGEVRWCRIISAPREQADGSLIWDGLQIDITEQKETEAKLRELNETLEARVREALAERQILANVVESTNASVLVSDLDYRILAINKANIAETERVWGKRPKVGDSILELVADMPPYRAQVARNWGRALAGEEFIVGEEFGDAAHERVTYEVRFNVLRDRDGRQIGAFSTSYDVSDRARAQTELEQAREALRQSQKMEAMGQLTGGVAHDFNNLLTPIVGSLDRLQRKGVGDGRDRRLIDGAMQSAERATTLVQRLLAFARRQPLQAMAVNVGALVQGMAELVASTSGPRVRVELDIAPDLPPALADANQLEMAILNLAVNARDAMPDGGTLTVTAEVDTVGPDHRSKLKPGRYVRLSVTDTGTGMSPEVLARAIEPFFSTKGIGKGTGLGLSMVHGLAAQLGGALTIASQPGLGTNVELWLPASEQAASHREHANSPAATAGAGTVLLVDDEALVRASTADMLADLGYAVIEAGSAEEALRLVREGLAPDLLVTDHLMPGMTGIELAREVRRSRHGTPVLIVSGYAETEGIAPDLPRLTKPFRQADLAASVAVVAERRSE